MWSHGNNKLVICLAYIFHIFAICTGGTLLKSHNKQQKSQICFEGCGPPCSNSGGHVGPGEVNPLSNNLFYYFGHQSQSASQPVSQSQQASQPANQPASQPVDSQGTSQPASQAPRKSAWAGWPMLCFFLLP